MKKTQTAPIAEALAMLSGTEHETLSRVFAENPGSEALFLDLLDRKALAVESGDVASLNHIAQQEKNLLDTTLRRSLGK